MATSMGAGGHGSVILSTNLSDFVPCGLWLQFTKKKSGLRGGVSMRDRGKNRKPLQKGRNLSIEAIQTIQALKRAPKSAFSQQQVLHSKFSRLLKLDMMAVLRELLRQDRSLLALMAFAEIQKEHWYKPEVPLYAEIILGLARSGLFLEVDMIFHQLKREKTRLGAKTESFNSLLETLTSYNLTGLTMDCVEFMKDVGCEPDRSTFKLLVGHLESKGEIRLLASIRQQAHDAYGDSLEFLDEKDEVTVS